MNNLDAMLIAVAASKDKRESELNEAFRNPDVLKDFIAWDCARLVAAIGGYASPTEPEALDLWIRQKMLCDAIFVRRVHMASNLVCEYTNRAMSRRTFESGGFVAG
jgi:hypothetical protein